MLFLELSKNLAELDAEPADRRHGRRGLDLPPELERAIELLGVATREAEQAAHVDDMRTFLRNGLEESLEIELLELEEKLETKTPATQRVYAADCKRFKEFCDSLDMPCLRAEPELVALFLLTEFEDGASLATVRRLNAAIGWAHRLKELHDPTADILVRAAVRQIAKRDGTLRVARPGVAVPAPMPDGVNGNAKFEGEAVPEDDEPTPNEVHLK